MPAWDYGACDAPIENMTLQQCAENFGNFARIAIFKKNADIGSFTATSILLSATWTAAIADTSPDNLIISAMGRLNTDSRTSGEAVTTQQAASGLNLLVKHNPDTWQIVFDGLTSANESAFSQLNEQGGFLFFIINQTGQVIASPTGKPFKADYVDFQSRSITINDVDKSTLNFQCDARNTVDWAKYDCSAFIFTIQ